MLKEIVDSIKCPKCGAKLELKSPIKRQLKQTITIPITNITEESRSHLFYHEVIDKYDIWKE